VYGSVQRARHYPSLRKFLAFFWVILNEYGIIGQNKKRLCEHFVFEMPQLVVFMGVKNCQISLNAFGQLLVSLELKGGKELFA
jgi:hypothetical protein